MCKLLMASKQHFLFPFTVMNTMTAFLDLSVACEPGPGGTMLSGQEAIPCEMFGIELGDAHEVYFALRGISSKKNPAI